jgi:hypothetical protein
MMLVPLLEQRHNSANTTFRQTVQHTATLLTKPVHVKSTSRAVLTDMRLFAS